MAGVAGVTETAGVAKVAGVAGEQSQLITMQVRGGCYKSTYSSTLISPRLCTNTDLGNSQS